MVTHQEDVDLLLSLQDRVLETPPGSPSPSHGYTSDGGSPRGQVDMSDFRSVVQDCLDDDDPKPVEKAKLKASKDKNVSDLEKFSGLRVRNQLLSPAEMSEHFSDIRFVRLPTIKNLLKGDTLSGCWATIGVLIEKGNPKTSSIGQTYCIWKIGCLDETTVTLFLFGDAYKRNWKEQAGTVFGLFRCSIRKDGAGPGFSLSINSSNQVLKLGTSVDYGVCKGKRQDGTACKSVINKRLGAYCKFHRSNAQEKFSTKRAELKGGNLRMVFRYPVRAEGIYAVDPLAGRTNFKSSRKPAKILSVDGLRKALSNAGKVTTNVHSQGIRFLTELTGTNGSNNIDNEQRPPVKQTDSVKRNLPPSFHTRPSNMNRDSHLGTKNQEPYWKRKKNDRGQPLADKPGQGTEKMIVLDYCSSDEEI